MTQATPSLSPAEVLAERADELGRRALRLRALSRTRPHVFLEDKEELARAIFDLANEMRRLGRLPVRTAHFNDTTTAVKGRSIPVERRSQS